MQPHLIEKTEAPLSDAAPYYTHSSFSGSVHYMFLVFYVVGYYILTNEIINRDEPIID